MYTIVYPRAESYYICISLIIHVRKLGAPSILATFLVKSPTESPISNQQYFCFKSPKCAVKSVAINSYCNLIIQHILVTENRKNWWFDWWLHQKNWWQEWTACLRGKWRLLHMLHCMKQNKKGVQEDFFEFLPWLFLFREMCKTIIFVLWSINRKQMILTFLFCIWFVCSFCSSWLYISLILFFMMLCFEC